jgi:hypothetical protein
MYHYSPASADWISAWTELALPAWLSASVTHSVGQFSLDTGRCHAMTTSEPSPDGGPVSSSEPLTLWSEDFPASPTATAEGSSVSPTNGGDGPGSSMPSTQPKPPTFFSKMSADCLGISKPSHGSSPTLPNAGSMRSGRLSARAPWVPHTCGAGCSLWPTPRRADDLGGVWLNPQNRQGGKNLREAVGGSLNPEWVEWLMGFPVGWTALQPWGTQLSLLSPNGWEES